MNNIRLTLQSWQLSLNLDISLHLAFARCSWSKSWSSVKSPSDAWLADAWLVDAWIDDWSCLLVQLFFFLCLPHFHFLMYVDSSIIIFISIPVSFLCLSKLFLVCLSQLYLSCVSRVLCLSLFYCFYAYPFLSLSRLYSFYDFRHARIIHPDKSTHGCTFRRCFSTHGPMGVHWW